MTFRDMIIAQIRHEETHPIPFVLPMEGDIAEQLDAHYRGREWRKGIAPAIVRVGLVDPDRCEMIDAKRERDAFGTLWRTDLRPRHHEQPGLAEPTFDNYEFPDAAVFIDEARRREALELCSRHRDRFIVAGFGWGLFERSWTIRGFENALMDCVAEPDFYEELLDRITELHLAFIRESVKLPVDGIMFSDDWGDQRSIIIGTERWRRMLKPRLAKLYSAVHAAGKFTLSHCCGNCAEVIGDLIEIGLDVLESVQPEAMNPYDLKRRYGDRMTFWGGLGSQSTIPFGTPEQIKAEVKHLCREMGRGGGYILGPSKALQPETPLPNAIALVEAFCEQ